MAHQKAKKNGGKGGAGAVGARGGPGAKRGGAAGGGKPHHNHKGGGGGHKRPAAEPQEEDGEEDKEAQERRKEYDAIEDMDVDSFMKSGMFDGAEEDDEDSAEEEADEEEEEQALEGEGEEGEVEESSDDEEEAESSDEGSEAEEEEEEDEEEQMLEDEVKQHAAELERLKAEDPEFFKFLEKNDSNLLSFGQDEDKDEDEEDEEESEDEQEEDEEEDEEEEEPTTPAPADGYGPQELTLTLLKTIEHAALEQRSIKGLRKLVLAFKAASHMADESSSKGSGMAANQQAYNIASSNVFDRLLVTCLTSLPEAFGHHLFQDPDYSAMDPAPFAKLGSVPAFRSLKPLIYRTLKALHYLLGQVTEPSLLAFTLSRLERFLPFLIPFPRLSKFYLKTLLSLWATNDALDVKLAAFLRIRQAATVLPFPFLEQCLKGAYLAYARNAKFTSETSRPGLTLMGNCLVELFGLDMTSAYQFAFVYLRQLALHLRAAYVKKTPEALSKVYCWQFLNCLKVWVAVLTAYSSPSSSCSSSSAADTTDQLRELVFPLTQIIIGVIKLAPAARHYPLALHCITLLQRLAARAQVFIPCAAYCLDMLENPALFKKPKGTTEAPPTLSLSIKLGKDGLDPKNVQEALVSEAMDVLAQEVLIYRYTIAFPEYTYPIKDRVRRFAKATKSARWRALARGLVEDIEKRAAYVEKERTKRELAPTDTLAFEVLRPAAEGQDAGDRLKAFLEAKAAREAEGLAATAPVPVPVGKVGGKKKEVVVVEKEKAEVKKVKKKKAAQSKQQKQGVPVDRMEDEVGDLGEWSDSDGQEEEDDEEEMGSSEEEE